MLNNIIMHQSKCIIINDPIIVMTNYQNTRMGYENTPQYVTRPYIN